MKQKRIRKALEMSEQMEVLVGRHQSMFVECLGKADSAKAKEAAETLRSLYEELLMTVSIAEEAW